MGKKICDHKPFFVNENVARKPRLFCANLETIFISKSDSDVKRPEGFFDPQKWSFPTWSSLPPAQFISKSLMFISTMWPFGTAILQVQVMIGYELGYPGLTNEPVLPFTLIGFPGLTSVRQRLLWPERNKWIFMQSAKLILLLFVSGAFRGQIGNKKARSVHYKDTFH